ncbi:unnamed protein product [Arabis nemorensis]|uniref:Uncharacterized protein n=1 Tax=Arabis nemorensis TaxID=586526 RepID=A0A565AUD8_9BRAS|nr:unnamed protein product [Arabis nemorensis]VVA92249.1 unnamed protein product [Arabis nemorensis]
MGVDSVTGTGLSLIAVVSGNGVRSPSMCSLVGTERTSRSSTGSVSIAGNSYCLAGSVITSYGVTILPGSSKSVGGVASVGGFALAG